jgi:hypothetical protein
VIRTTSAPRDIASAAIRSTSDGAAPSASTKQRVPALAIANGNAARVVDEGAVTRERRAAHLLVRQRIAAAARDQRQVAPGEREVRLDRDRLRDVGLGLVEAVHLEVRDAAHVPGVERRGRTRDHGVVRADRVVEASLALAASASCMRPTSAPVSAPPRSPALEGSTLPWQSL